MLHSKGRILIADDRPDHASLITAYLISAGYEVNSAGDEEETLRLARSERPDLVVLDARLQQATGIDVCRQLKDDKVTGGVPVIVIAAERSIDERVEAHAAGADDMIGAPIERVELLLRVESQLKLLGLQRQLDQARQELATLRP